MAEYIVSGSVSETREFEYHTNADSKEEAIGEIESVLEWEFPNGYILDIKAEESE